MTLSSISLKNVRKHADVQIQFADKLHYIVGGNGQGKTTILESVYYLCTTKSSSTKTDSDVVTFGENTLEILGEFHDRTKDRVQIIYSSLEGKKNYMLNGKVVSRNSDVIGKFPVVLLSPTDHSITMGTPGERRRFVDSVISQASSTYLEILLEYNRTLRQRSVLLSRIKEGGNKENYDELEAWTQKLVNNGAELIKHRIEFLYVFNEYMTGSYNRIMQNNEIPEISYFFLDGYTGENLEERFSNLLKEKKEEELRRTINLAGPHRDDFIFEINNVNLRTFGSQGQHKTFQVALRFAEFFYLKDIKDKTPLFLLDDVFSELDADRAIKISEYLGEVGQAFVTLTDLNNFSFLKTGEEDKIIEVNNSGGIKYARGF